jgi:hypothetical protein
MSTFETDRIVMKMMNDANEHRIKAEFYKSKLKKVLDGIDDALFNLTNEDTTRPEVIEQIHRNLIDIYNEGMSNEQ